MAALRGSATDSVEELLIVGRAVDSWCSACQKRDVQPCNEISVIRRFCRRDPIRYRHLAHGVRSTSPPLDAAIREYYGGDASREVTVFVDNVNHPQLMVLATDGIRAEGSLAGHAAAGFAEWCRGLAPRHAATTHDDIQACLAGVVGADRWSRHGVYSVTADAFRGQAKQPVRMLSAADAPAWDRFIDRNASEPIVRRAAGGSGAVARDFEFMCRGLPVTCYATFEKDRITGMISANPFTDQCDEVSVLFVEPAYRRRGCGSALLSVAVRAIFARRRIPAYNAAENEAEIVGMLTKQGFAFRAFDWDWWA